MGHRINERNIGNIKLDGSPKKGAKKLTSSEKEISYLVLERVYDRMRENTEDGRFYDNGDIVLTMTGEQMYDLFHAIRKLKNE